MEPQLKKETV